MTVHVIDEANRCLNCKKPMCRQGCPIQTPIPMMIKAFKEGDLNEAGEMLFSNNPMSQQTTEISGFWQKAKDALSGAKDSVASAVENVTLSSEELVQKVETSLSHFVEAVAVMLITSCVIPLLVLFVFFWLIKILVDVDFSSGKFQKGNPL